MFTLCVVSVLTQESCSSESQHCNAIQYCTTVLNNITLLLYLYMYCIIGFVAMVTFTIHVDYHYCIEKFPKDKDKDMITDKNEEEKGNDEMYSVVEREREGRREGEGGRERRREGWREGEEGGREGGGREGGRKIKRKERHYIVFYFNNLRATTCTYYLHYSYRYMAYQMHWLYRIHIADHSPLHYFTSICALLCVLYCYQLHWIKSSCTHR